MLINCLKVSLRLLLRNPFLTCINVIGLSVGFAVFATLWQYSRNELASDRFHPDSERIYRFGMIAKWSDDKVNWFESAFGTNCPSFSKQVADQYSEIEAMTRILVQKNVAPHGEPHSFVKDHGPDVFLTTEINNVKSAYTENKLAYGDPNLFSFFSIPLTVGNKDHALDLAGSVALSEKSAVKYFGTVNSIGKTLLLNDKVLLTVTGVFKDLPSNTHLDFDLVISSEGLKQKYDIVTHPWMGPTCYFKLKKNTDPTALSARINNDLRPQIKKIGFGDWEYGKSEIYFQALHEMPFQGYRQDFYSTKSKVNLTILQGSAFVVLLLAWINYLNLAVSAGKKRVKEIVTRKAMGAKPGDFIIQFGMESIVINFIAGVLAATLVQLAKSPMGSFFGFYVPNWNETSVSTLAILVSVLIGGVLFTGIYPAFVYLKQSPNGLFNFKPRKEYNSGLVFTTFQYGAAISIVILVFVVTAELEFIQTKDIGLDKSQTVVVDLHVVQPDNFESQLNSFITEAKRITGVTEVTASQSVPGDETQQWITDIAIAGSGSSISVESNGGVDENFIPFYKIKMLAGRNFIADLPADQSSILLSESAASRLGFTPESVVGKKIFMTGQPVITVIGVFKDYKLKALLNEGYLNYGSTPGLALTYKNYIKRNGSGSIPHRISFRILPGAFSGSISTIEKKYAETFPGQVFNWYFLDQLINGKYQQQITLRNQIYLFSFMTIGIACLGLLAMVSNKIIEKTKEIGIRKVLGAEMHHIGKILLDTTFKQVVMATVFAIPVSYYLGQVYLEKFSEKISLQWWHYVLPVMILLTIMFCTIATALFKAARSNPVEALKYE